MTGKFIDNWKSTLGAKVRTLRLFGPVNHQPPGPRVGSSGPKADLQDVPHGKWSPGGVFSKSSGSAFLSPGMHFQAALAKPGSPFPMSSGRALHFQRVLEVHVQARGAFPSSCGRARRVHEIVHPETVAAF